MIQGKMLFDAASKASSQYTQCSSSPWGKPQDCSVVDLHTKTPFSRPMSSRLDQFMQAVTATVMGESSKTEVPHLLMPPLVSRALPSVLDIFIWEPLFSAFCDTVKGGFHSTKHLGPWGDPSSEMTSTCSTPAQPLALM